MKGATRRLFLWLLLWGTLVPTTAGCQPGGDANRGIRVDRVHDGDTLRLADGRKVRLIGINAPELGRDGGRPQPFAIAARDQLRQWVQQAGNRVMLEYGEDRQDRYGRLLAHVSARIDGSETSLNARLIEAGLATAFTTPPNVGRSDHYYQLQRQAAAAGKGIWSLPEYRPVDITELLGAGSGYRIVDATIDKVQHKRSGSWLHAPPLKIFIADKDRRYFSAIAIGDYRGKRVRLRGWIKPDRDAPARARFMKLRHPSAIELININGD